MKLRTILLASAAVLVAGVLVVQAQVPGVNSTLNSIFTIVYESATSKQSYRATSPGISFTVTTTATDVCTLTGSATKTIRVRTISVYGTSGTLVHIPALVFKRSTANSGGTAVAMTTTPLDSSNTAATATAAHYTANPTLGTAVGEVAMLPLSLLVTTTAVSLVPTVFTFGTRAQALILRGVAQQASVNLNAHAGANAAVFYCIFEWTEE